MSPCNLASRHLDACPAAVHKPLVMLGQGWSVTSSTSWSAWPTAPTAVGHADSYHFLFRFSCLDRINNPLQCFLCPHGSIRRSHKFSCAEGTLKTLRRITALGQEAFSRSMAKVLLHLVAQHSLNRTTEITFARRWWTNTVPKWYLWLYFDGQNFFLLWEAWFSAGTFTDSEGPETVSVWVFKAKCSCSWPDITRQNCCVAHVWC